MHFMKKQNPRGEVGHPDEASLLPITTNAHAGIWTRAPPCWKSCRHFAKDKKKNQIKSVEHVCEIYEKIRKHDCDNIFVSASYTYFFLPALFFPIFLFLLCQNKTKKKELLLKSNADVFAQ